MTAAKKAHQFQVYRLVLCNYVIIMGDSTFHSSHTITHCNSKPLPQIHHKFIRVGSLRRTHTLFFHLRVSRRNWGKARPIYVR